MQHIQSDSIINIKARSILDSRGFPTVEVDVTLQDGSIGRASVPSGASTGEHEAYEMRDNNAKKWLGKGVEEAVNNINVDIYDILGGLSASEQLKIDAILKNLDGTKNKSRLGANALLAVSLAVSKAAAKSKNMEYCRYVGGVQAHVLPVPMMNIINGGAHADNKLDFQEFMIVPHKANCFQEALRMGTEIYHTLKANLISHNLSVNVGDEGGFAPDISNIKKTLDFIVQAIKDAGYLPNDDVMIALDVAASEFYKDGCYYLSGEQKTLTSNQLISYYQELCSAYPIFSIEDGMAEDDWQGWQSLTQALGEKIKLVGDDLFVTNIERLKQGIIQKAANAILIKPNQIGTLSETLQTVNLAQRSGFNTIMSHRSGETEDTIIADLSVALNTGFIKTGAPCRSERNAKYNELIRLEERLAENASFFVCKNT